ncbi:putative B3 domain-containing protein At5g66980 [Cornus florida]|uniref:putative B3 domain-containing protein At5g66980 n=1 Tax=Cornus florida TaxID=4283 RepID=UPI00289F8969|nr:putative B3 domain-containing protein At5g66980 [Cornus florida]
MVRRRKASNNHPEFFKVYFPEKSSQQLCVPPAFIKHFNGTIPTKAILKDLSGKCWHVEMEDVENGVFIKNGWQCFVNHYSVELGDFLVFRYNGNSLFNVRIYGRNGCGKEDSLAIEKTLTCVKIEEETEAERTFPKHTNVRKRKYSEISCKRSPRSIGLLGPIQLRPRRIASESIQEQKVSETAKTTLPKNPYFIATFRTSRTYALVDSAIKCFTVFQDFKLVSRLERRFRGKMFAEKNIPKCLVNNNNINIKPQMVFRDQNQKSWPVRVVSRKDGRVDFAQGFRKFLKDNSLRLNDKCIFEFFPGGGRSSSKEIQVQIIRAGARTQKKSIRRRVCEFGA